MKTKITFSLLLVLLTLAFVYDNTNRKAVPPPPDTTPFLLGAMNNWRDWDHKYVNDTFGMNLWHKYTGSKYNAQTQRQEPLGWYPEDSLLADTSVYAPGVRLHLNKNESYYMKSLMHRPKIEWLCYGQRSDYQCENDEHIDDYYWFYSFQTHTAGASVIDSGNYVRYCQANPNQPGAGWVAKRLRANNEQNNIWKDTTSWSHWDDSRYRWYIKPRIRIDSMFAHTNQQTPVCSIKVIGSDGSTIKNAVIKGLNFLDQNLNYNGRYLEEFYWLSSEDSLFIQGAWGDSSRYGWTSARGNSTSSTEYNPTDIQVWWYGNCDMWIDYVRVDNEIADQLFKGVYDTPIFGSPWLQWEAALANQQLSNPDFKTQYRFYIEELDFNNVPCISYVNQKLQQYTSPNTVDMMVCFYWANFTYYLPWDYVKYGKWSDNIDIDAVTINHVFLERANLHEFFTEIYPFTGNDLSKPVFSKIPSTLPNTGGNCVLTSSVVSRRHEACVYNLLCVFVPSWQK